MQQIQIRRSDQTDPCGTFGTAEKARRRVPDSPKTKNDSAAWELFSAVLSNTVSTAATSPERNISNKCWPNSRCTYTLLPNRTVPTRKGCSAFTIIADYSRSPDASSKYISPHSVRKKLHPDVSRLHIRPLLLEL